MFLSMPDPLALLKEQSKNLTENGYAVINVPDVTEGVSLGDISIATHQHLNSFTIKSLHNLVQKSGLNVVKIIKSGFGDRCTLASKKIYKKNFKKYGSNVDETKNFLKSKFAYKFNSVINLSKQNKSIGFICLKIFHILPLSNQNLSTGFGDQKHWHGRLMEKNKVKMQ